MLTSHELFKPSVRGSSTRKEGLEQLEWIAFRQDACRGTMIAFSDGCSTYVRRIYIRIYFPDHLGPRKLLHNHCLYIAVHRLSVRARRSV